LTDTPQSILKNIFGYDQFKPLQREVIQNVLLKRDSLAIMPTGGGKSLCYQIPALLFTGLTVVVSPLISLMKDQVEQLHELDVPAIFLNSSLSTEEYQQNLQRVRNGQIKLLYVAPETLLTPRLFNLLDSIQLDCLTIDEAHCISEWGHDFRPEYRQMIAVRDRYPQAVCLALTATATPRVRTDIKNTLRFDDSNEFIASFNRDNLIIEVDPKNDPATQTLRFLERFPKQSGIIYCFSRKQVDELSATLTRKGFSVRPYHAGLADEDRRKNQELFIRDDVQIIVATIAFGMGINKPNVRFVVHYDLPKSIESYYQEIGRAGRDGLPAHCLLLYSYGDTQKLRYFVEQKAEFEREVALQHLNALTRYAESDVCRRVPLLAYFGETYTTENCGMCDNCLSGEKEQVDITIPAQKFISCVKRTGERFGAGHVIDVLLGSENEKVKKYNHQSLSTYGIGQELARKQWQHIGRQLIQKGLLAQDDQYGGLQLTPKAYTALKNKEIILGVLQEEEPKAAESKTGSELEYNKALFEVLRAHRKELADAARVPPYVIFSDRTLVEMAAFYPVTAERMLDINGVGQVKYARYGQTFSDLIAQFCAEHQIVTDTLKGKASTSTAAPTPTARRDGVKPRQEVVGEAYNGGESVTDLCTRLQVQPDTIFDHLVKYALSGNPLRKSDDFLALSNLSPEVQAQVLAACTELGVERLRPLFERMGEAVSYEELKILRLHYLTQRSQ
jgi:ATP-dependent DNA helicase RecQ